MEQNDKLSLLSGNDNLPFPSGVSMTLHDMQQLLDEYAGILWMETAAHVDLLITFT
jgi:hypothetical protein